ncbi:MAG: ferrochelatase [Thaumarchaeota archaeon]|nr:ferrochelatase [Nitrososphaerota archaeon]
MNKAVLLMAYGTPRTLDDVEAYYTHIRGGLKPSEEALADLVARYKAIGGVSPLIEITQRQRQGLEGALRKAGSETRVYAAMKHSPPFIADVVRQASEEGVDSILTIALAPHYSRMSIDSYISAVNAANESLPKKMEVESVESWFDNPVLVSAWHQRVKEASAKMGDETWLVFTAHSLPARILQEGDPYRDELLATSGLVADSAGYKDWSFSFQSASKTGEPWLGPDILEHLNVLHDAGKRKFLIAPVGFVADHLEILYDIDVECREWAKGVGAGLDRCRSLNASPEFIDCLFSVVEARDFV